AIEFLLQACEAIAEAHALGIVHRDLKPANLFVTRRVDGSPCIKVLDFGISKLTVPGAAPEFGMTKTHTVMGSPLYMSPEQMSSSRNVDMRADIWALGVILYETLTGRVPFEAETMPQLCGMILQEPPRPIHELRPDLPQALQHAVLRCLEKNREHRFNNVAELAYALVPFADAAAQRSAERIARVLGAAGFPSAPPVAPAVAASSRPGAVTSTNFGASGEARKSRTPLLIALCLLGLLLGAGLLFATRKTPALDSASEPASSLPIVAAASPASPASPGVEPQLSVPPVLAAASTSAAPSATAKAAVSKAKSKPQSAKNQPVPAQRPAPAIDPLDGRR
ncbi:MAG TPA: serine/threonine-protein kinase, partial [Polyangiaceae bacterium]